ncbi:rho GTPase-activating protein 19-like isoform X1 [Mizuhopecten yessoensis]|uniref:rho GTPase-activating protein 19-like isoform X1 n=1 Tax=Mizuhopecten yessoensis TaxID=6573 RepID=UPI000B457C97|nr:rho GTPase-activating protein 19-like isoform X1 [Mizuhopecten yessoensis]
MEVNKKKVLMVLPQSRMKLDLHDMPSFSDILSPYSAVMSPCAGFHTPVFPKTPTRSILSYDMSTPIVRRRQSEAEKNVNRLRNCMPEKFSTLVKMHLSFLLDLDGTKLEEMFLETNEKHEITKRKPSTPFSKKKEKHQPQPNLFGASLTQENVSQIYQLIDFLGRPDNIRTEGLFRKTGNFARQRLLKEWLISGTDLGLDHGTFSPHDCATVLKNFLGELPEPLLTEKHYQAHLQVTNMGKSPVLEKEKLRARSKQIKTLQLLFLLLPRNNVLLLECLIDLLHRVTKVSENMMTASSLGTVFAPHLLCPRKMSPEELQNISPVITQAASFMIESGTQIFKVPRELAADIANFWREMEDPNKHIFDPVEEQENTNTNLSSAKKKYGSTQAINTVIAFAERKSSSDSDTNQDTQVALAQLYAHVQSMPDSSKKKKLLKQFNRASQTPNTTNTQSATKSKHTRSRTFGSQIKKHFPSFHKNKRHGTSETTTLTSDLPWSMTSTINIDQMDDSVFGTPIQKTRKSFNNGSPAVHIVDMKKSPETHRRPRKRLSSEGSDGSLPDKRPTPDMLPSTENEIDYIIKKHPERRMCPCTTPDRVGKPIAMVSPITHSPISQSVKKVPPMMQKNAMTPRSRAPLLLLQSPNLTSRESLL